MSQDVGVLGTGGAIFAGTLLIVGGVLWMLQAAWARWRDLHRRHLGVRELYVHPPRALAGIDDHLRRPVVIHSLFVHRRLHD
jgi:hypothetical protein